MTEYGDEHPAVHARTQPDKPAVIMAGSGAAMTYRELDEASNRVAQLLRARGLHTGDHIAVLTQNELDWYPVVWGAHRSGIYVTTVNWHLTADEAGYIVRDCGAVALVVDAAMAELVEAFGDDLAGVRERFALGGAIDGFEPLDEAVAGQPATPIPDEAEGQWMFYSSGTTGRPKGILSALPKGPVGGPSNFGMLLKGLYRFTPETVYLSPAPIYHAAPAGWTTMTQRFGGTAVVMEHFDPIAALEAIERYRVTHVQFVPTHLIRLLKLPEAERARFDLSSLELVVHAAAPCPVEVKRAAIEWLGPIVYEFYSGSEGSGFCAIGPEEWLAHPGSVGKSLIGTIHILGEDGDEVPVGTEGEVWFEAPHRWQYHGDPDKTAAAWDTDRGWSTIGDVGRLDDEGYLYLTDRTSNMIISGGVNIYPRETEDVLVLHPAVADVAVIGLPDPDMGEQVAAFVQLVDEVGSDPDLDTDEMATELIDYCRARLSHFKCPRTVRFVDELPRLPTGKLLKRLLVPSAGTGSASGTAGAGGTGS